MPETWTDRDLPVLRAIVDIYEETGRSLIRLAAIQKAVGFDEETVTKAVRMLDTEPYFDGYRGASGGHITAVGKPNSKALRVAGQWPSPEGLLERLVTALDEAGDDGDRPEEERSKLKRTARTLGGLASRIAIDALGGAGGNLLTGG